jgi:hypothetical protein
MRNDYSRRKTRVEKITRLMISGLARAATEPQGLPLLATKAAEGLYPATALGRSAADRALQEGWLTSPPQSEPLAFLSDSGRQFLIQETSPKILLEDFLRIVEARQTEVQTIARQLQQMTQCLAAVHTTLKEMAHPKLAPVPQTTPEKISLGPDTPAKIENFLKRWQYEQNAQDCPLPQLYAQCGLEENQLGHFHDCLRALHKAGKVALHPWTGPLYAIPEPTFALLIGHEIAYYINRIDSGLPQ